MRHNYRKESEKMKIVLAICLVASLVVNCILKMMVDALSLYIKDTGEIPDKENVSQYSKRAVKKFFHIPS